MNLQKDFLYRPNNKKLKTSLSAAFLLSLTLLFFGPMIIYYTNIHEMPFLLSSIGYYILAIVILVGSIISIILWRLSGPAHTKASSLIFALGLLFWIQGNILVWDYGVLDGHEIVFKNYFWYGAIDLLVWISIIIAAFKYSNYIYQYIAVLCSLLIIVQATGLMALESSSPDETQYKNLTSTPNNDKMFEFSTSENVVILILDTFQSNKFQEIIDDDPEYRNMFDGFTYYRNNVGGFPSTYLSVMYILSGKLYNNSITIGQFLDNTSLNSSLPSLLNRNGFETGLNSKMGRINGHSEIYDIINTNYSVSHDGNIPQICSLYKITFFRFVPQPIKPYFVYKSIDLNEEDELPDMGVYYKFKSAVSATSPDRTFKLFHLRGPHPGNYMNENLEYDESATYKSTAKGSLKIAHALLEALKLNGVYNNSMIFIIGDHGTGSGSDVVSGGIPLMLAKPFNSTGPLKSSDSPVSLGDIPKTVADELKIDNDFPGLSIFSAQENSTRIRTYYSYFWVHEYWQSDYLPPLKEYNVSGFSWDPASWEPTYREYTSDGVKNIPPPMFPLGSVIHFENGGNAGQYLEVGWSNAENKFRWTDGHVAVFACTMPKPETDIILNMTFAPFLQADMKCQNMSIWMNKHKLQDFSLTSNTNQLFIVIPRDCFEENIQKITFELPDAASPSNLGISNDRRTLGIAVRTLSMSKHDQLPSMQSDSPEA